MRSYLKGLLSGILIMAVMFSIPVFAESIWALFNTVRININGIDKIRWGESYTLDNGNSVPYSIIHNDTTYMPLRKFSEIFNKQIYWNGDSSTVSFSGPQNPNNQTVVAEKEDSNGNVWTYYIFTASETDSNQNRSANTYLGVKDTARNFERIYRVPNAPKRNNMVRVTDEAIYFAKATKQETGYPGDLSLQKINFLNDENSQDGEEIKKLSLGCNVLFDNDYIYYTYNVISIRPYCILYAENLSTGEITHYNSSHNSSISDMYLVENNEGRTIISYTLQTTSPTITYEIEVFKDGELRFGEPKEIQRIEGS